MVKQFVTATLVYIWLINFLWQFTDALCCINDKSDILVATEGTITKCISTQLSLLKKPKKDIVMSTIVRVHKEKIVVANN